MNQGLLSEQLLSKRMVVPLFMFCGFAGGLCLIFASIFIPGFFGDGSWLAVFSLTVIGVAVIWFGLRPRVAVFYPESREVLIGWGVRWTWKLKTIRPEEWIGLEIDKVLPVAVYPHHVSHLPPRWKLSGLRQNKRRVILADYPTEQEATEAKEYFAQQFKLSR